MAKARSRPVAANDNYPSGKTTHQRPALKRATEGKLGDDEALAIAEIERLVRTAETDLFRSPLRTLTKADLCADNFDEENNRPRTGLPDGHGVAVVLRQGRTPEWWASRSVVDLSPERLQARFSALTEPNIRGDGHVSPALAAEWRVEVLNEGTPEIEIRTFSRFGQMLRAVRMGDDPVLVRMIRTYEPAKPDPEPFSIDGIRPLPKLEEGEAVAEVRFDRGRIAPAGHKYEFRIVWKKGDGEDEIKCASSAKPTSMPPLAPATTTELTAGEQRAEAMCRLHRLAEYIGPEHWGVLKRAIVDDATVRQLGTAPGVTYGRAEAAGRKKLSYALAQAAEYFEYVYSFEAA